MFIITAGYYYSNKHKRGVHGDGSYGTCPHYGTVSILIYTYCTSLNYCISILYSNTLGWFNVIIICILQYVKGERGYTGPTGPKVRLVMYIISVASMFNSMYSHLIHY